MIIGGGRIQAQGTRAELLTTCATIVEAADLATLDPVLHHAGVATHPAGDDRRLVEAKPEVVARLAMANDVVPAPARPRRRSGPRTPLLRADHIRRNRSAAHERSDPRRACRRNPMSATTLTAPMPVNIAGVHTRPVLGRLIVVELRKMLDTRAGFWLRVATVAITVVAVIARSVTGDATDHTFASVLSVGLLPAAVLLPVAGILLVTSEWSQRTGMITFALVPVRSRILGAKLIASIVLSLAMLVTAVAVVAAGVAAVDGTWSDAATLIAQSAST